MNKKKMYIILRKIISFFEEKDITYWLDSGTLLGFAREGDFIEWDNDIDISTLGKEFENKIDIEKFKLILEDNGYTSYALFYKGDICVIKFIPKNRDSGLMTISIVIFWENNNFFWVPGWKIKGKEYSKFDPRYYLYGLWRMPLRKFGWHSPSGICKKDNADIGTIFRRLTGKIVSMVYPKKLIGNTISVSWAPGKVPEYWNKYLTYRYGNWKVPVPDWDTNKDDKAYKHCSFTQFVKKLSKKKFLNKNVNCQI